jgi:plasmid maintenance system killer protein
LSITSLPHQFFIDNRESIIQVDIQSQLINLIVSEKDKKTKSSLMISAKKHLENYYGDKKRAVADLEKNG